jgi:PAP2 superfamily
LAPVEKKSAFAVTAGDERRSCGSGSRGRATHGREIRDIFAAFATLARVFLGIHYPSDVVVGALIGAVTNAAVIREAFRTSFAGARPGRPPFLALAEMSNGFPNKLSSEGLSPYPAPYFPCYGHGLVKTPLRVGNSSNWWEFERFLGWHWTRKCQ